jgi:hypothetical protein
MATGVNLSSLASAMDNADFVLIDGVVFAKEYIRLPDERTVADDVVLAANGDTEITFTRQEMDAPCTSARSCYRPKSGAELRSWPPPDSLMLHGYRQPGARQLNGESNSPAERAGSRRLPGQAHRELPDRVTDAPDRTLSPASVIAGNVDLRGQRGRAAGAHRMCRCGGRPP